MGPVQVEQVWVPPEAAKDAAKEAAEKVAEKAAYAAKAALKKAAHKGAPRAKRITRNLCKTANKFSKKALRKNQLKTRTGLATGEQIQEAYEKIDQSKSPVSREEFIRGLEADRARYLKACIQVTTMVAQAKMLWTSMA